MTAGDKQAQEPLAKRDNEKLENGSAGSQEEERETWSSGLDFTMSALSFAVGMGNMWRFPYLCYMSGGGAFLIPYVTMVIVIGFPMVFLEFSFGQYGRLGVVSIWKCCPLFQGVGWSMFFISGITMIYYNMLNAWCIFYIISSFAKDVPWKGCHNTWNTDRCGETEVIAQISNCSKYAGTYYNDTCYSANNSEPVLYSQILGLVNETKQQSVLSSSDEFFHRKMLGITDSISDFGELKWELAICLLFVWALVFVVLLKGIKASGKVTYVTSVFPYIILIILFGRAMTLEGSVKGIMFYITPDFNKLLTLKVWVDAAVQVFFSLSACWGGLITLASYNSFKNNCLRDAIVVTIGDCLTSIFGGIVIFAFLGYMSEILQKDISDVATQGAGLAFIVYPEAVTTMPISPLWAILFMIMLLNVGIGTQFGLVQTVHAVLTDTMDTTFNTPRRRGILLFFICLFCYGVGLFICTGAGMYVLQLMDTYAATYGLLYVGILLSVALPWVYGMDRFGRDIEQMMGSKPSIVIVVAWKFVTPLALLALLLFTFIDFKRTKYSEHVLPLWAEVIGWSIAGLEFLSFPVVAVYNIVKAPGSSLKKKLVYVTSFSDDWDRDDNGDVVKKSRIYIPMESIKLTAET